MSVCGWLLERDERVITMGLHLLPWWYARDSIPDHLAEHEGVADEMDALHIKKIAISSEIFVVNKNDYIGDSTRKEINYANSIKIPIRWYTHDKVGEKVEEIIKNFLETPDCTPQEEGE